LHKKISQSFSEPPPPANISEATWTVKDWSQPFVGTDLKPMTHVMYQAPPAEAYQLEKVEQMVLCKRDYRNRDEEPEHLGFTYDGRDITTHRRLFPQYNPERAPPVKAPVVPLLPGEQVEGLKFEAETTNQATYGGTGTGAERFHAPVVNMRPAGVKLHRGGTGTGL
jgi:hypothetical protein